MAGKRQSTDAVIAKGKKHFTKAEIEERRQGELVAPADHIEYPKGAPRKYKPAGNESAAFESGDSSCNPECDHLCRGAYSTVCSQWIWIPVCGWIYSIKQIIWSFRDGCRFIRICNYNLCRPESWCKEISENPERCA